MRLLRTGLLPPPLVRGRAILQNRRASRIASLGILPSSQWYVTGNFTKLTDSTLEPEHNSQTLARPWVFVEAAIPQLIHTFVIGHA
jgi:hypothetical protein